MTADVELLPLPEGVKGTLADFRDEGYPLNRTLEHIEDYARACVEANTEALRAEVRDVFDQRLACQHELNAAEARAERLAEALRGIADIATGSRTANSLPHIEKIARAALHPTAAQENDDEQND